MKKPEWASKWDVLELVTLWFVQWESINETLYRVYSQHKEKWTRALKKEYHWPVLPFPLPLWVFSRLFTYIVQTWTESKKKEGVQVETQNWMHDLANCFIQLLLTCCCRQNPIAVCLCNYRSLGYLLFIHFLIFFITHMI